MSGHWFDLILAGALALVAVSVLVKGLRERSRKHIFTALAGFVMAAVLVYLHRAAFLQ